MNGFKELMALMDIRQKVGIDVKMIFRYAENLNGLSAFASFCVILKKYIKVVDGVFLK
ncbi:hypothetical protein D2M30_0655 [Bacillus amyloliquefaciens]|nr:hypothetical protein D2M30_0655 [Bacillus amyloliquefaciens]